MKRLFFVLSALALVTACTQERPANVVFKGGNLYDSGSETSQRVEATPVHEVKTRDLAPIESPSPQPALGLVRRIEPQPSIHIAENPSVEPVRTQAEFQQVLENLKHSSAQSQQPITLVAIPVEKGVVNLSATPQTKPAPPSLTWSSNLPADKSKTVEGFVWPVRGKVLSTYGAKPSGAANEGINIAAPEGKAVGAAADGEVVYAGNELDGYGNMIILRHNNSWMTAYAHLSKMKVGLGTKVQQGQIIAEVGKTGNVSVPQLHFAVRRGKDAVNPMDYLGSDVAAGF